MPASSKPTDTVGTLTVRVVQATQPELVGRALVVGAQALWVGRGPDCDLVVSDASVSRRHASLEVDAGGIRVTDNGSANGVLVDGRRIEGPTVVPPNGHFTLGAIVFGVLEPEIESDAGDAFPVDRTVSLSSVVDLVRQLGAQRPLEELGDSAVVAANKPFLINDPDATWLVVSGKLELFTVRVENGQPTGTRTHFLSLVPGQMFFGVDSDRSGLGWGFLAVGKAGSQLRRFNRDQLVALAAAPNYRDRLATLVSDWVTALSRRLTEEFPPLSGNDLALAAGTPAELRIENRAVADKNLIWLEMPGSRLLFDGMASLSWEVEGVLFPLAAGSWLELVAGGEKLTFDPVSTVDSIADPRLWAGLDVFHRVLCECEFLNKKLATVDEFLRLQNKEQQVEQAREAAYGAIGSVLGGTGVWERPMAGSTDLEPVLRACMLIGQRLGIEIKGHPEQKERRTFEESVQAVCVASRIRSRQVALVGDWYRHDQGPVLGQFEESKAPVALLPLGTDRYEAVGPDGKRQPVTAEFAAQLTSFAYTFYRGFGDELISARGLLRFGMRGLGSEFRTVAMMGVGLGLLGLLPPLITGKVFDTAIPQAERSLLFQFSIGLFMVALGQAAFKVTQSIAMLRVQGKMDYSLQAAVWDRLLELPSTFFRRYPAGDLADRAAGVDQIRGILAGAGVAAILGSVSSLFNLGQMVAFNLELAAIGIGLTVLYVGATITVNLIQLRFQRNEAALRGRISGLVLQLITGVAKLRVSGTENHAFRVWATAFAEQRRVGFRAGRVRNAMAVWNSGFPIFSSIAIFLTMVSLHDAGQAKGATAFTLTTGEFLAFNAAYGMFLAAIQALGDASVGLLQVVPVWERLKPIVEVKPEVDASKAYPGRLKGGIEVSHVHFRYSEDSPWILKDISLTIKAGEMVALVGGSGSGKSTLLRVLLGFEHPEKGAVYYDGQDLSTLDVRLVRRQLGVVLQDSRVLPTDIYRNIVGASSRTVQDAWDAAQRASLADDIRALPMGMHTYVSEGGGGFSGGQKQRLMIARAIVNQPKVIFLDEATSALDNRAQSVVTESLDRLQATRVVIAHRLSTIVNADCIYYLEDGAIKESGSYAELIARNGAFAALARRQLA
jgi:NHLM bacteriocin system ABC transporter ATP-binding protein